MTPLLACEIISALVALIALVIMLVRAVMARFGKTARTSKPKGHVAASTVLIAASIVHGACATAYASGANILAYVFGWCAVTLFVLSGICMAPPLKARMAHARFWHLFLFAAGIASVIAHAIAGRL